MQTYWCATPSVSNDASHLLVMPELLFALVELYMTCTSKGFLCSSDSRGEFAMITPPHGIV